MSVSFEELVAEYTPPEGEFVDFEGSDSCEGCEGWDGKSRRCSCGNRRVDWVLSLDGTYVYAEAY